MTTGQIFKEIQEKFDLNPIYARIVSSRILSKNQWFQEAEKVIAEKPKPFVKWVGGKRQLLAQFRLRNLFPPELFDPIKNTYFEPFVGGGAVFFDLLPKNAVLSDMNNELVTTYNVIKNDVENLIKSLKKHKVNKDLKVGGTKLTIKKGTVIKNIKLTGDVDEIECRYDNMKGIILRTEFLRKRT